MEREYLLKFSRHKSLQSSKNMFQPTHKIIAAQVPNSRDQYKSRDTDRRCFNGEPERIVRSPGQDNDPLQGEHPEPDENHRYTLLQLEISSIIRSRDAFEHVRPIIEFM